MRRAQRRAQAEAITHTESEDEGLNKRMDEVIGDESVSTPATVEDYAEREDMRSLFDEVRK